MPGLLPLSLKERHDDGRETITSAYLPLGGDLSTDSEAPARGEPGLKPLFTCGGSLPTHIRGGRSVFLSILEWPPFPFGQL